MFNVTALKGLFLLNRVSDKRNVVGGAFQIADQIYKYSRACGAALAFVQPRHVRSHKVAAIVILEYIDRSISKNSSENSKLSST